MNFKLISSRTWQTQSLKPVHFRPIKRTLSFTSLLKAHGASQDEENAIERTRNIGIIAHIDAVCPKISCCRDKTTDVWKGKTTTTERMLYYSGYTRRIGSRLFTSFSLLF